MRVRERFTRQNGGFDDYGFIVFFCEKYLTYQALCGTGAKS